MANLSVLFLILIGGSFKSSNQIPQNTSHTFGMYGKRQLPQGVFKTVPDYIRQYGYPAEVHEVTTADGYILTMIRIPFGRKKNLPRIKAILLHHGLISDCSSWILNEPNQLLSLQLADLGYDVWLANARGTRYSRRHIKYTAKDKAFFQYSMDDIGKYDVPAEIDYILNATGFRKIQYMGHSMGGILFHIAMSNWPEYNNKITLMIGVAPAVYTKHTTGLGRFLLGFGPLTDIGLGVIGHGGKQWPAPGLGYIIQLLGISACPWRPLQLICKFILDTGAGPTFPYKDNYAKYLGFHPSSSSEKVLRHFWQMIRSGNFEHFDYGRSNNIKVYGTVKPPLYYLNDTTAPVGLFYGVADNLVPPKDVLRVASELPNDVYLHGVGIGRKGGHADFVLASNANEVFNKYAIDLLLKY